MVRLIMFTGKGGVGKTTTSVAVAIWFANHGFKTILLSADPAHSIGDSLKMKIGSEPVRLESIPNMWAMEIDGKKEYEELKRYIQKNSKNNMDKFLTETGLPGMTELAALYRVFHYVYDIQYDIVVVDTPPSGHTLEMLDLPQRLNELGDAIKNIFDNLNTWKSLLAMSTSHAANDRIESIQGCVMKLKWLFRNTNITSFNLVSTAEYMSLREEMRTYNKLTEHGISVNNIVLNKLQPGPDNGDTCMFCRTRRDNQAYYVNIIDKEFSSKGIDVVKILASPAEIVGTDLLVRIGNDIIGQMKDNIMVKPAYATIQSPDGGVIVQTQLPYVEPKYMKVRIENSNVVFRINYGLHQDIVNILSFRRPISKAEPFNDNNKLSFKVV